MSELDRTIGQLEAGLKAMNDKLDHIVTTVDDIDQRLKVIETRESERKGAFRFAVLIAGVVGAAAVQAFAYVSQLLK